MIKALEQRFTKPNPEEIEIESGRFMGPRLLSVRFNYRDTPYYYVFNGRYMDHWMLNGDTNLIHNPAISWESLKPCIAERRKLWSVR